MVAFDAASLWLLMQLGAGIWGERRALQLGWTYSLLFVPLIFGWWTFEGITAFFILLALYLLQRKRPLGAAAATALGALTKLVPILVLPAVVRSRPWRRWLPYVLVATGLVLVVLALLLALGGPYALASLRSVFTRGAYETVWALLKGYTGTGMLVPIEAHFDLDAVNRLGSTSSGWFELLKTGLFGLLYAGLLWKARLGSDFRRLVSFVCLTLVIFFLWSKGWSPQWQVFLFPLIFLSLPYRQALLFVLTLSAVNLAEWPVLLGHGLSHWLWLTVLLRSGLFLLLGIELWRRVRR